MVNGSEQMASNPKEILNESVHREKPLCVGDGREPAHLPFALPHGLMGDLRSIVLVLPRAVHDRRHHGAVSCCVAAELIRDQPARLSPLSFQQHTKEARRRLAIAP